MWCTSDSCVIIRIFDFQKLASLGLAEWEITRLEQSSDKSRLKTQIWNLIIIHDWHVICVYIGRAKNTSCGSGISEILGASTFHFTQNNSLLIHRVAKKFTLRKKNPQHNLPSSPALPLCFFSFLCISVKKMWVISWEISDLLELEEKSCCVTELPSRLHCSGQVWMGPFFGLLFV